MEWEKIDISGDRNVPRSLHSSAFLFPPKVSEHAIQQASILSSSLLNLKGGKRSSSPLSSSQFMTSSSGLSDFLILGGGTTNEVMNDLLKVTSNAVNSYTTKSLLFQHSSATPPPRESASLVVVFPKKKDLQNVGMLKNYGIKKKKNPFAFINSDGVTSFSDLKNQHRGKGNFIKNHLHTGHNNDRGNGNTTTTTTSNNINNDDSDDSDDDDDDNEDKGDNRKFRAPSSSTKSRLAEAISADSSSDEDDVNDVKTSNHENRIQLKKGIGKSSSMPSLKSSSPSISSYTQNLIPFCKIVLFGGHNGESFLNDLWFLHIKLPGKLLLSRNRSIRLDDLVFEWEEIIPNSENIPCKRSKHTACLYEKNDQQFMVIFGGSETSHSLDDMWMFDLETLLWKQMPNKGPWPSARCGHSSEIVDFSDVTNRKKDRRMVVFFGKKSHANCSLEFGVYHDCWVYDFRRESWTEIIFNSSTTIKGYFEHSCCYIGKGCFFLFGGKNVTHTTQNCYVVDLVKNEWIYIQRKSFPNAPWPDSRGGHVALFNPLNRHIIIHGGNSRKNGHLDDMWMINVDTIFTVSGLGISTGKILSPRQRVNFSNIHKLDLKPQWTVKSKPQILDIIAKCSASILQEKTLNNLIMRYEAYMDLKAYDKALKDIRECLEIDKKKYKHMLFQCICWYKMRQYPIAVKFLNELIQSISGNISQEKLIYVSALRIRAKCYLKTFRFQDALLDTDTVLALYPSGIPQMSNSQSDFADTAELIACISCFKTRLDALCFTHQYDNAHKCCDAFEVFLAKEISKIPMLSGFLHKKQITNYDYLSAQQLKLKYAHNAISSAEIKHFSLNYQLDKVEALKKKNDFTAALKLLLKLNKKVPTNERIKLEMAICYLANRQYKKAISIAKKIITMNRENVHAYMILGDACVENRKITDGIKYYTQGVRQCETDNNQKLKERNNETAKILRKKIEDAAKKKEILKEALDHGNQGLNYRMQKDFENALQEFSLAIEKDKTFIHYYIDRAKTYLEMKDYINAVQDMLSAVKVNPDNPLPYKVLGTYLINHHHFSIALRVIERGIKKANVDDMDLMKLYDRVNSEISKRNKGILHISMAKEKMDQIPNYFPLIDELKVHAVNSKTVTKNKKQKINQILTYIEDGIRLHPKSKQGILLRARVHYALLQFDKCIEDVKEILSLFTAEENIELVISKVQDNRIEDQEKKKTETLTAFHACYIGAKAQVSQSNISDAISVIELFPDSERFDTETKVDCQNKLIEFKKRLEKAVLSIQSLEKHVSFGRQYLSKKLFSKAVEEYKKSIDLIDRDFWVRNRWFTYILFEYAECLFMNGNFEQSLEAVEKGIHEDRELPFFYTLKVLNLLQLEKKKNNRNYEECISVCENIMNTLVPYNSPINYLFLKMKLFLKEQQSHRYLEECNQKISTFPHEARRLISKCIQYNRSNLHFYTTRIAINLAMKHLLQVVDDCKKICRLVKKTVNAEIEILIEKNERDALESIKITTSAPSPTSVKEQISDTRAKSSRILSGVTSLFRTRSKSSLKSPLSPLSPSSPSNSIFSTKKVAPQMSEDIKVMINALYTEGTAHLMMGNFSEAKKIAFEALKISPQEQRLKDFYANVKFMQEKASESERIYHDFVKIKGVNGKEDLCIKILSSAIVSDPSNPLYYVERGRLYLSLNMPKESYKDADRALKLNMDDVDAYEVKLKSLFLEYKFDEAKQLISDVKLMIDGHDGSTTEKIKSKMVEMEEYLQEAEEKTKKAKEFSKDAEEWIRLMSEDEELSPQDFAYAERKYHEATIADPDNPFYLHKYIEYLVKQEISGEKLSRSCSLYVKLHPRHAPAYALTTDVYMNYKKDYKEALYLATCGLERNKYDILLLKHTHTLIQLDMKDIDKKIESSQIMEKLTFSDKEDDVFVKVFIAMTSDNSVIQLSDLLGEDELGLLDDVEFDDKKTDTVLDADTKTSGTSGTSALDTKRQYTLIQKKKSIRSFAQNILSVYDRTLTFKQKNLLSSMLDQSTKIDSESQTSSLDYYISRYITIKNDKHYFYTPSSFHSQDHYDQWKAYELRRLQSSCESLEDKSNNGKYLQKENEDMFKNFLELIINDISSQELLDLVYFIADVLGIGLVKADVMLLNSFSVLSQEDILLNIHVLCKVLSLLVKHVIERSEGNLLPSSVLNYESFLEKALFLSKSEFILYEAAKKHFEPAIEKVVLKHYRSLITHDKDKQKFTQNLVESSVKSIYYMHIISLFGTQGNPSGKDIKEKITSYIEQNHKAVSALFITESKSRISLCDFSYLNNVADSMTKYVHGYISLFGSGAVFPDSIDSQIMNITINFVKNLFTQEMDKNISESNERVREFRMKDSYTMNNAIFNIPNALCTMSEQLSQYGYVVFEKAKVEKLLLPYLFLLLEQQEKKLKEWAKTAVERDTWKAQSPNIVYTSSVVDILSAVDRFFDFVLQQCSFLTTEGDLAFEIEENEDVKLQRASNLKLIYVLFGEGIRSSLIFFVKLQLKYFYKFLDSIGEEILKTEQKSKAQNEMKQASNLGEQDYYLQACTIISNVQTIISKMEDFISERVDISDEEEKKYIDYRPRMHLKDILEDMNFQISKNDFGVMIQYFVKKLLAKKADGCFLQILENENIHSSMVTELMDGYFSAVLKHLTLIFQNVPTDSYRPLLEEVFNEVIMLFKERLIPSPESKKTPIHGNKYSIFIRKIVPRLINFFTDEIGEKITKTFSKNNRDILDKSKFCLDVEYVKQSMHILIRVFSLSRKHTSVLIEIFLSLSGNLGKLNNSLTNRLLSENKDPDELFKDMDEVEAMNLEDVSDILLDYHSFMTKDMIINYLLGILYFRGYNEKLKDNDAKGLFDSEVKILESTCNQYEVYCNLKQSTLSNNQIKYSKLNHKLEKLKEECEFLCEDYSFWKVVKRENAMRKKLRIENNDIQKDIQRAEHLLDQIDDQISFIERNLTKQLSLIGKELSFTDVKDDEISNLLQKRLYEQFEYSLSIRGAVLMGYEKCMYSVMPGYLCTVEIVHFNDTRNPSLVFIPFNISRVVSDASNLSSHLFLINQEDAFISSFPLILDGDLISWVRPYQFGNSMDHAIQIRYVETPKSSTTSTYQYRTPQNFVFHNIPTNRRDDLLKIIEKLIIQERTDRHDEIWMERAVFEMQYSFKKRKGLISQEKREENILKDEQNISNVIGYPISPQLCNKFKTKNFSFQQADRLVKRLTFYESDSQLPGILFIFTSAVCYDTTTTVKSKKIVIPFSSLHKATKVEKSMRSKSNLTISLTHRDGHSYMFYANSIEERDVAFETIMTAASHTGLSISKPIVTATDKHQQTIIVLEQRKDDSSQPLPNRIPKSRFPLRNWFASSETMEGF